jgi:hypothetical protein
VDIRVESERLMIADSEARNRFEDMLQSLDTAVEKTVPSFSDPIVIVRSNGRHPVIVTVLPQLLAKRNQGPIAFAILIFVFLEQRPSPPTSLLTKIFGLTPAEARLAARLAKS